MQLGYSAAGLIMIEATAIERVGRLTHNCVRIYNDLCEFSIKKTLEQARSVVPTNTSFSIQLSHAVRKASTQRPWEGRKSLTFDEDPWITKSASPVSFDIGWHVPQFLSEKDIKK